MKAAYKLIQCQCSSPEPVTTPPAEQVLPKSRWFGPALLSSMAIFLIRLYQLTRFLRRPSCRFYPSCSQYTCESIEHFGIVRGSLLGAYRLLRCHPWHPGGVDEVPVKFPGINMLITHLINKLANLLVFIELVSAKVASAFPAIRGHQARGEG